MTPFLLQPLHAALARRRREPDLVGKVDDGKAPVGLQGGHDASVDVVEVDHGVFHLKMYYLVENSSKIDPPTAQLRRDSLGPPSPYCEHEQSPSREPARRLCRHGAGLDGAAARRPLFGRGSGGVAAPARAPDRARPRTCLRGVPARPAHARHRRQHPRLRRRQRAARTVDRLAHRRRAGPDPRRRLLRSPGASPLSGDGVDPQPCRARLSGRARPVPRFFRPRAAA